ncbi:MAG: hypothetical protein NXI27_25785 [Alphaproteobacteria bacterium]|nr:hypothetical protein [Alphaproteobacteria bacterium]
MASFQEAFDAFCEHLKSKGYLHSWRLWQRTPHEGYDSGFPDLAILLEMCFHNHQASLDCWDYVEAGTAPLNTLHVAMNRQIQEAMFALYHEIG